MIGWGLVSGVVTGLGLALAGFPWLGALFTNDPAVRELLVPVLLVAALGPAAWPAWCSCSTACSSAPETVPTWPGPASLVLVVYAPVVLLVAASSPCRTAVATADAPWIWVVFTVVFMGARAVVLLHRERGDAWMVTGVR